MNTVTIVLLVILAVLIIAVVALYFLGKKAQKRQAEQQQQAVIEQAPKLMRSSKLPIVKAKVGPQVMSLVCEEKIFDSVPVKKEVKAVISGIYITDVKGLHGKPVVTPKKKKGWLARTTEKLQEKAGAKPVK